MSGTEGGRDKSPNDIFRYGARVYRIHNEKPRRTKIMDVSRKFADVPVGGIGLPDVN